MYTAPYTQEFLQYLSYEKRYSAHTIRAYTDDLSQFFTFISKEFDELEIAQIKGTFIRSFLASLKDKNITPKSINRKLSTLKTYFKFLLRNQYISASPLTNITAPKISKRLPQYVEEKDIKTLFQHVEFTNDYTGALHRAILSLFYYTGMRLSELQELQLNQVNIIGSSLKVLGKGNKERIIPIVAELKSELSGYLLQRNTLEIIVDASHLLLSVKGKKLYAKYIYTIVKRYLGEVTTISKKSPHILRHSFATHLTNNGAELNAVKELLGHASLAATQIYTHNSIEKLKAVYKKAHPKA
jgi:integrase/recombinase XerC